MLAPKTIHFISLGCAKNRVDTEVMLGVSGLSGFAPVDDPESAEVIVVNTCGFIDAAKQESVDTILEMAELKRSGREGGQAAANGENCWQTLSDSKVSA